MRILSLLTILLYGLSSLFYLALLFSYSERLRKVARLSVGVVIALHFVTIGSYCTKGFHPLLDIAGTFNLIAFLLAVFYLIFSFRWKLVNGGAAILPLATSLVASGQLTHREQALTHGILVSGKLHLILVAMGVVALALASAVSLVYLKQNIALKKNQLLALDKSAPALTTLDSISQRLIWVGFPLFILAVVMGFVWSFQLKLGFKIEHLLSFFILGIYLVLIITRYTIGLRGRRAAILTLISFGVTALVLAIYLFRRILG